MAAKPRPRARTETSHSPFSPAGTGRFQVSPSAEVITRPGTGSDGLPEKPTTTTFREGASPHPAKRRNTKSGRRPSHNSRNPFHLREDAAKLTLSGTGGT